MNILTNEIIENLNQKGIILNPFLSSYRSHSNLDIKHYGLPQINKEKQLYLDNNSSKYDLIIGTEFNVLFRRNSIREFKKINAKIDFVSLKKGDNIGIIPRGYGGIVRLQFEDKVPEITNLLVQSENEKYDDVRNDTLYFTTQEVMDKILEELDKQENPIV